MDSGLLVWIIPISAISGGAVGWFPRQYWQYRATKREAALDAGKILKEKKAHIEEMVAGIGDDSQKEELCLQLDEVNAALLGLHAERLRRTLKDAGLPPEEALIADGLSQLQPQQITKIKEEVAEAESLPQSNSIRDLMTLASAYYYAEQYEEAKEAYNRILKLTPNNADALNNRGVVYAELERYDDALADYNRSLELRPNDAGALNNRGAAYTKLERYDDAFADLNRSLELRPNDAGALNNRGVMYAKLERYDDALADLNRSLELNPDDHGTFYNLACLFSRQGKADDALTYLEKAININKKYQEMAKTDTDFDNIRNDPRFKKLIEPD
ncbi:tetratricopeptide repeat protein [Chloroflexota bacterium]